MKRSHHPTLCHLTWIALAAAGCIGCSSGAVERAGTVDAGGGTGGSHAGGSSGAGAGGRGGSAGGPGRTQTGSAANSGGGTGGAKGAADAGKLDAGSRDASAMAEADAAAHDSGPQPDVAGRSTKRGVAYDLCKGFGAQGQSDLDLLRAGTASGSGITWFYNWGTTAGSCLDLGDKPSVEYVPMAWGLSDGGSACASGGACFNDGLTIAKLIDNIPQRAHYLLGFNEPNFAHQSNLTPSVAARAWQHLERVAEQRALALVSPATNYCDPNPSSDHAGSCTKEPAEHSFHFTDYDLTVPAGHRYNAFEWAELFYDECSAQGAAATDCRIDYQAGHVYSYWGLAWYVEVFKRKAGIAPATEDHCKNKTKDADEFAVDCGGNACAACSAWARKQFSKALWITELAPSTDDGPSPRPSIDQLVQHASDYIRAELPKLEQDDFVFRYAWFMPRTDIASLDHVDLLTQDTPAKRTSVGVTYLDQSH